MKLYNLLLLALLLVATSLVSVSAENTALTEVHTWTNDEIVAILEDPEAPIPEDMTDSLGDFEFMDFEDDEDETRALRGSQQEDEQERRKLPNMRVTCRTCTNNAMCHLCDDGGLPLEPYKICKCSGRDDGVLCSRCWGIRFDARYCDRFCRIGFE